MKLNPSQAAVVAARDKRILVLAGAGTGKTATSVHWVAGLVKQGIPRSSILMITFTRKASEEMSRRAESLLKEIPRNGPSDAITVGTYHAVAITLMRRDPASFGLATGSFSTLDESECASVWKSAFKQCGHQPRSKLFIPDRLGSLYSLARNTRQPIEPLIEAHFGPDSSGELGRVIQAYTDLKRAANAVDYDDLLTLWEQAMQNPAYGQKLRDRWLYVLVDEMQDNNPMNQAILQALNPHHLLVVGDPNQSIYAFRGSDVTLISEFAARNLKTRIFKLEDNYRSGQTVLDLANRVVPTEGETALKLTSHSRTPGLVRTHTYVNPNHEAKAIAEWIIARDREGLRRCDAAILARSSKDLTPVEIALSGHRIRYRKYGGLTLAEASEIKDYIAFLRLSHNSRDKIALLRALTQFPGIGEGTAARVVASHDGTDQSLFADTFWPQVASDLPVWLREMNDMKKLPDKGRYLFEKVSPLIQANYSADAGERLATIKTLVDSMDEFEGGLTDFLDSFTVDRHDRRPHPADCATLSTIHSAKGLEWHGVWLVGSGSMQIPHRRTEMTGEVAEEKRLLYVAVTRAKQELVLSYPTVTARGMSQYPCPFLPEDLTWDLPGLKPDAAAPEGESGGLASLFQSLHNKTP